jgi:subtilisin-like proprotein convertase family protein
MRRVLLILFVLGLPAALPLPGAGAAVITGQNATSIAIPDFGAAAPYPSPISVSGAGSVEDVNVTIRDFMHSCPADVDVLLAGPGGQNTLLFSEAGGDCIPHETGATITFDDEAAASYPCDDDPSGTFKPTNDAGPPGFDCEPDPDTFSAPAPGGPYPASLAVFDGTAPTGTWNLFVFDDAAGDTGSIGGGWSLTIDTTPETTITGHPPNKSTRNKVKYQFSSEEPGSSFECLLPSKKRKTFTPCASPFKAKVGEGKHKFLVRAKDSLGVDATPARDKFKILD